MDECCNDNCLVHRVDKSILGGLQYTPNLAWGLRKPCNSKILVSLISTDTRKRSDEVAATKLLHRSPKCISA